MLPFTKAILKLGILHIKVKALFALKLIKAISRLNIKKNINIPKNAISLSILSQGTTMKRSQSM